MRLFVFLTSLMVTGHLFAAETSKVAPEWSMNATIIEACSCPMFCQCYFNEQPAGRGAHGETEHFCRFNNVFQINTGRYGDTKLDGAKFWVAGDLGGDFSKGQMDWAHVVFDPSVTKDQREGVKAVLGQLYPVKWNSFTVGKDAAIEWKGGKDRAVARLDEGTGGEVILKRASSGMTEDPVVIKNLKYWGAPRNDGFILMPNEVEAFRAVPAGKKPFQFEHTNGFMITIDINSKDFAKVATVTGY